MAGTTLIPLVTLPVGTYQFGPMQLADGDSLAVISIDRTVAGGLNSLTPASQMTIEVDQSADTGATWAMVGSSSIIGGQYNSKYTGQPAAISNMGVGLSPRGGVMVAGTVTVAGTPVTVQGSLVIS